MTQGSQTPPTGHLMIGLLEGFMWLDRGLQDNLRALGLPNVRRLESMVMLYAAAGIRRPTELARTLGVTRQSINSAIRELEEKELIELSADPLDGRCKIIEFSKAGEPVHLKAMEIMASMENILAARIGRQEVADLAQLLNRDWGDVPLLTEQKQESA